MSEIGPVEEGCVEATDVSFESDREDLVDALAEKVDQVAKTDQKARKRIEEKRRFGTDLRAMAAMARPSKDVAEVDMETVVEIPLPGGRTVIFRHEEHWRTHSPERSEPNHSSVQPDVDTRDRDYQ